MMSSFRVDTHLFRELGALLVGRDSTALAELIKNSYDADATEVYVEGLDLRDPTRSRITIVDNGNGMTPNDFEAGFLTIAARSKSGPIRHSPVHGRRYTGAKGIGRLAAHKLAHVLEVVSIPRALPGDASRHSEGVHGLLDWDRIEERETLDDLQGVVVVEPIPLEVGSANFSAAAGGRSAPLSIGSRRPVQAVINSGPRSLSSGGEAASLSGPAEGRTSAVPGPHGTTVVLQRLRRPWTERDLARFVNEVRSYEPPAALFEEELPSIVPAPLMPGGLAVRSAENDTAQAEAPPFRVILEGEFDRGESFDPHGAASAHYVLEVSADGHGISYGIARTRRGMERLRNGDVPQVPVARLPLPEGCPSFQARILLRIGSAWPDTVQGIRVYMEGFRVLPYGEVGNDWLSLDDTYTRRSRSLVLLDYDDEKIFGSALPDEGLLVLRNNAYLGAVFLTEGSSPDLQMLVNREGFVPSPAYYELVKAVNRGIGFLTRVRQADNETLRRSGIPSTKPVTRERGKAVAERVNGLSEMTARVRGYAESGNVAQASKVLEEVVAVAQDVADTADDLVQEINMLRVLASVGTQLTAFVHELNGLLAVAQAAQRSLEVARLEMDRRGQRSTAQLTRTLEELRRGIERQASYLVDVTSADARRRRSAQRLGERVEAAFRVLERAAALRGVRLETNVDHDLRTRPMFRAELTAILTNLLTNAIKAAARSAGHESRVVVGARVVPDGLAITIQNTGVRVDPEDGERWFKPYATSSTDVDPLLGQGMGLGLPITRALVEENAGTVRFVTPAPEFSTAVEVFLPARSRR